ncbi:unnamed protein product [Effrenium voratum]|nr:unnamed protein product [Effrenium voratum]
MPTPTATPRGVATPRAEGEHTLALEDGQQDAGEVGVTISKSLEDVKDKDHRPSTSESVNPIAVY